MPAATNQTALKAVTIKEFDKLSKLIAPLTSGQATKPFDGTTIKDVIGHRAHWTTLFLGWYADGQAGKDVVFPAPGYKWNELKRYNADLRETQKDLSWDDACVMLRDTQQQLLHFIETHNDAALYGGPMKGAKNDWTPGRWAEAAGASHYRSAAKFIRAALRSFG